MSAIEATVSSFKSMADGCIRIAFDFNEADSKSAKQLLCDVGAHVAIARLSEAPGQTEGAKDKPYGAQAEILYLSKFFYSYPEVWAAVGTDAEFRAWIQKQPSCLDGNQDWVTELGEGMCEAAHVRRAGESGTAQKSAYSCVPLTHEQHQLQHSKGELAVIKKYRPKTTLTEPDEASVWFNSMRIAFLREWCWEKTKRDLGYTSFALMPPSVLQAWAGEKGVGHLLPSGYCE